MIPGGVLMSRTCWSSCGLLALAALLVGCGGPPEDKLVKGQLANLEKLAAVYSKVTDEKSMIAAEPEIAALRKQLFETDKKLDELGADRKATALAKVAEEFKQATKNVSKAKNKAASAAFGLKLP